MKTLTEAMKSLKEERFYFGEIENLKDQLNGFYDSANKIQKYIQSCMENSYENEYNKDQFEMLKQLEINIQNIGSDIKEVNDKLGKAFPNRIRSLTTDEKEMIKKMKNNGEI